MSAASRLLALAAALLLGGCAAQAQIAADAAEDNEPAQADGAPSASLPAQELTEPLLYELLLAEVALQRGDAALAARTYLELARRTKDPRVARRAVEVANAARAATGAGSGARLA